MRRFSRDQVQEIDQRAVDEYGIPSLVLMENAGRGAVDILCRLGIHGPVVICCGRGNNGGDGLVIARHLDRRGFNACVLHWTEDGGWSTDAAVQFGIVRKSGIDCERLSADQEQIANRLVGAEWIVDALLGTGASGDPRAPYDSVIAAMNAAECRRFAVDVPSGLDCETGISGAPTFRAEHTCTFVAAKHGMLVAHAQPFVGKLHVADIGAPRRLLEDV